MIDAGTVTDGLLLARVTASPPVGAAAVKLTVHDVDCPAPTVDGEQLKEAGVGKTGTVTWTDPPVADNGSAVPVEVEAIG